MSIDNYKFHQCIGKGNFGDVYKATSLTKNSVVAIKVINLDETNEDIKVLIQEIQFLSRLKSPHITNYIETFLNDMSMFIVMEFCGGGSCADLLKYYKKLPEEVVAYIIRDVLRGLNYLHQEKKVHRDIKSANILLTNKGEVKLADFGVSGEITMTQLKRNTFVGTPFWMAPEVIARRKSGGYNEKADIWSTGITTIELVTGSPPLSQFDPMKILFEIPKNKPPLLTGMDFSENIKDFVRYCLLKDPKKRPSSSKLLHHRFITSVKANVDLSRMIDKKNQWFELNNKAIKKPRYQIFSKPEERNSIKWDLNTFKSFHSSQMQQTLVNMYNDASPFLNKPCESNDLPESKTFDTPITNVSNIALKSPISSALSSLPVENHYGSPDVPILASTNLYSPSQKIADKRQIDAGFANDNNQKQPLTPKSSSPIGANASNASLNQKSKYNSPESSPQAIKGSSSPYQFHEKITKGEILFYCLEQVYMRGRSESTKLAVHQLITTLLQFESQQPGLSEAIVEEIFQFRVSLDL